MWNVIPRANRHRKAWLLLTAFVMSLFATLFLEISCAPDTGHAINTHGCAPATPSPGPGSPTPTTPIPPPATKGVIMINEVLTNPNSIWNCADLSGNALPGSEAWVELYNTQSQPFNLYGVASLRLNNGSQTFEYLLPPGAIIAAHGFLVLFPSGKDTTLQLTKGELQFVISGTIIDYVNIPVSPALMPDQSYARMPDGGTNWQLTTTPTIDASNLSSILSPTPSGPTPTHVTLKRSGKRSRVTSSAGVTGSDSGSSGGTDETAQRSDGVQPGWSNLQLPATASSTAAPSDPGSISPPQSALPPHSSNNGGVDPQHIVLFTLLGALLAGVALWGWWRFKSRELT